MAGVDGQPKRGERPTISGSPWATWCLPKKYHRCPRSMSTGRIRWPSAPATGWVSRIPPPLGGLALAIASTHLLRAPRNLSISFWQRHKSAPPWWMTPPVAGRSLVGSVSRLHTGETPFLPAQSADLWFQLVALLFAILVPVYTRLNDDTSGEVMGGKVAPNQECLVLGRRGRWHTVSVVDISRFGICQSWQTMQHELDGPFQCHPGIQRRRGSRIGRRKDSANITIR